MTTIILLVLIVSAIFTYNGLVKMRARVDEAWADIEIQLRRRYDLIPNLVETVKGYASHEKGVFERIAQARADALSASQSGDPKAIAKAEGELRGTLKTLFSLSESYPELKASDNFLELQRELRDTEDKVQASRRFYNTNVRDINTKIETFPSNIIANIFSFSKRDFFEIDEPEARGAVNVNFKQ